MTHKEIAMDFLRLAASGQVKEAYDKYIAPDFRHHNPYYKGDRESLLKGMEESAAAKPQPPIFEIKHAIEDGDLVAVHSRYRADANDRGGAVVHICRFENDLIVELWDVFMFAPEESANENGLF